MLSKLLAFFAPVAGSVKDAVNVVELERVIVTSATSGLVVFAIGVITAIQADLPNILAVPGLAGTAAYILTHLADSLRRLQHDAPAPAPAPAAPAPQG